MRREYVQAPWVAPTALVIAAAAFVVAVWPVGQEAVAPSYTDEQIGAATTSVCAAYHLAFGGVSAQTNLEAPPDASGPLAAAANARLSLIVASDDIRAAVNAAPAAPAGLRDALQDLATQYRTVATNYLAGLGNDAPPIAAALKQAGSAAVAVNATCKK